MPVSTVTVTPTVPPPAARSRAARLWGETWRILVAGLVGFVGFGFVAWEADTEQRWVASDGLWALDFFAGVLGLALLPLRRRAPLTIAVVLSAMTPVSVLVSGAQMIAFVSLATHRRWWRIGIALCVAMAGSWAYAALHPVVGAATYEWVVNLALSLLAFAALVWIGAYIGLRREHLASLRERAETAEREQASRVAHARSAERERIAREMHDVLAHRMSLVAMHAGALAYRTDLPQEKVAETAAVVQASAHAALVELRGVLGVLRDTDGAGVATGGGDAAGPAADAGDRKGSAGPAPRPEPPQPTLADLDDLLEEARGNGTEVRLERRSDGFGGLGDVVGRHAFRIVQEGLTNARKHAPWAPVTVVLEGEPGEGLSLVVRNPVRTVGADPDVPEPPSSHLGLLGLTERAALTGGRLEHGLVGGEFVLRAWLPWAP